MIGGPQIRQIELNVFLEIIKRDNYIESLVNMQEAENSITILKLWTLVIKEEGIIRLFSIPIYE